MARIRGRAGDAADSRADGAARASAGPGRQPASTRPARGPTGRVRSLEVLARLCAQLADNGPLVVDADLTSRLLAVTPRTARRQLRALADEGLALPLPPERAQHPGRPRQAYRLVAERLSQSTG